MNNIPSSYLDKIRAVYPNIPFNHLDFNQDGMVNDVVVVNHEFVCRFAKQDWGKQVLSLKLPRSEDDGDF